MSKYILLGANIQTFYNISKKISHFFTIIPLFFLIYINFQPKFYVFLSPQWHSSIIFARFDYNKNQKNNDYHNNINHLCVLLIKII